MYSLFAKNFRKATGLNIDVNKILCNCKSDDERIKLYDKFSWMMQRGARINNTSSEEAKEYGLIDKVITTNLTYQTPELLSKEWYVNSDLSKYIALLIDTLNHDVTISDLLNPTERIQAVLARYNENGGKLS